MAKKTLTEQELEVQYPRRSSRKKDTRLRILKTAKQLFSQMGYKRTTMALIAERAEVHVTTVFNHFSSKADLMANITSATLTFLEDAVRERTADRRFFSFYRDIVKISARDHSQNDDPGLGIELFPGDDPEILPAWLNYEIKQAELFATCIAKDYNINQTKDPRPRLVANMLVTGNVQVYKEWRESGCATNLEAACMKVVDAVEQLVRQSLTKEL